jgi:copper chaperone CopZ
MSKAKLKEETAETKKMHCESCAANDEKAFGQGILYGLIPHTGCIAFIIASVLGATAATQIFKPLLLNPYFFYILIALSFVFATASAIFYLKRQGFITLNKSEDRLEINFSPNTIRRKWKYLSTLYGSTIGINLILFMVIFPLLANVSIFPPAITSNIVAATSGDNNNLSSLNLQVDIPCSGHAPLITDELKSLEGVSSVQFNFPNIFNVKFDAAKTTKEKILSLEVFKTYKATLLNYSESQNTQQLSGQQPSDNQINIQPNIASKSCCGSGSCRGNAEGCGCNRR